MGFIAHEISHTWWGWLTPSYGEGSKFLREAMAEFSSLWALDRVRKDDYLKNNLIRRITSTFNYDSRAVSVNPERYFYQIPLIVQEGYDSRKVISANYQKGPVVVNQLRLELGDDVFFKGLRTFIERYKGIKCNIDDFIKTFNDVSGKDLSPLFKNLLWSTGYPVYRLCGFQSRKQGDRWMTAVEIANEGDYGVNCPLLLRMSEKDKEVLFKVEGKSKKEFHFETPNEVEEAIIDPDFISYQYSPDQKLRFWTTYLSKGGKHWTYFFKSYALYVEGEYQKAVDTLTEFFTQTMNEAGKTSIEELSRSRGYKDAMYFLFMRGIYHLANGNLENAEEDIRRTIPFLFDYLGGELYPTGWIVRDLYADGIIPENDVDEFVRLIHHITGMELSWDENIDEKTKIKRIEAWKTWWENNKKDVTLNLDILY